LKKSNIKALIEQLPPSNASPYPEEYQVAVKHISEQSSVEKSDIEAIISKIQTKIDTTRISLPQIAVGLPTTSKDPLEKQRLWLRPLDWRRLRRSTGGTWTISI
jgi:hypothetical protein